MAEAQARVAPLQITLTGLVAHVTQRQTPNGLTFRTLIRTPAPDAYSTPGTFEIRSLSRLGKTGDEVKVLCTLIGYSRTYDNKDGETVKTAEHVLQAI